MQIHNFKQYSPEWWKIREKRLTASHGTAIASNGAGLKTYVLDIMRPLYSSIIEEPYTNKTLERGLELEDSAAMVYSFETGNSTKKVGFVTSGIYIGVSPDILVNENGLGEIKCPEDKAYFRYLHDKKIDTGHEWQMQMQMLVCKKEWCEYIVYNPNFDQEIIITRVLPDKKKIAKLEAGIESGIKMIKDIEEKMKS